MRGNIKCLKLIPLLCSHVRQVVGAYRSSLDAWKDRQMDRHLQTHVFKVILIFLFLNKIDKTLVNFDNRVGCDVEIERLQQNKICCKK